MNPVIAYLKSHGGYGSMRDMKAASIQTREIARLLENGSIEKIKPGLYRLAKRVTAGTFRDTLIDACEAMPRGVICLLSALDFHDLTTFNPSEVYIAIPHSDKPPKISYPPVRTFFFRNRFYAPGILSVRTPGGIVRIYNREKTVCDMFRYRHKLGENLAVEGLKAYLARKDANLVALRKYAELCQVKTTLMPYLKAIVT
jgi:predicted transcriptional regulator of viral defense system